MRTIDLIQFINDATALRNALQPLVDNALATGAEEVSDADVAAASAKLDTDIARVQAKIDAMPSGA